MINCDLCTKYRNNLVGVLNKLNAANEKYVKRNDNELVGIIQKYLNPLVSRSISSLEKNKASSGFILFGNEKMGKKFIKLIGDNSLELEDIYNDLMVLLNSLWSVNCICGEWEYWNEKELKCSDDKKDICKCVKECQYVFFDTFKNMKTIIEKNLISQAGYNFLMDSSVGKCRVFSRKKCECFVTCYINIVKTFLQTYDAFVKITNEKKYEQDWDDCEENCRQNIEIACGDAVMDALDCLE